jgi:predicted restriction endonuclease
MGYKNVHFKSFFKAEPAPKKDKKKQWNDLKKRAFEKMKAKNKNQFINDEKFYREIWNDRAHFCSECGCELIADENSDDFLKQIRWYSHHICPKAQHQNLRYVAENIILLCQFHHSCAESVISYPKMRTFSFMESVKKELLDTKENE